MCFYCPDGVTYFGAGNNFGGQQKDVAHPTTVMVKTFGGQQKDVLWATKRRWVATTSN